MSRYHWLSVRVRLRGEKKLNIFIPPISIHTLRGAVLSCDGIISLLPRQARVAADTIQKALAVLQDEGMDVDVKTQNENQDVCVRVRMV